MSEIHWIKLKTVMFDDEKIQLIEAMPEGDAIIMIWIKILTLAGKSNYNGKLMMVENILYSPEMLATIFRRPLHIVKFALKILKDFGMIEVTQGNLICITNWEKHQNSSALEKIREDNRKRVAKFRQNRKIVTLQVTQGNAIESESESESESEKEKNSGTLQDNQYYLAIFNQFLPPEIQSDWCAYLAYCYERADIHLNRSTVTAQLKFLREHIPKAKEIMYQSIKNNWKGLFEIKDSGNGTNKSNNQQNESSTGADAIRNRFSPENLARSKYHKPEP